MPPFFSICIPATGRSKTIIRCIDSVLSQTFRDFELVIVTRNDSITYDIAYDYLANKNSSLKYSLENLNIKSINSEDWNDPILKSSGMYISMLEGDDFFEKNHLKVAYDILSKNSQIGIYISSTNRTSELNTDKLYSNYDFYNFIYSLKAVPAPSEVIFKRYSKKKKNYVYDVNLFHYAPEIDLYLKILKDDFWVYKSSKCTVYREASSKPYDRISWVFYRDHFLILFRYFRLKKINYFFLGLFYTIKIYFKSLVLFILWKLNLKK